MSHFTFDEELTEPQRRVINRALARYSLRAFVGFLLLFAGFFYNACNNSSQWERIEQTSNESRTAIVTSGRVVSVDGCNRAYEERVKIRDVFLTSQSIVATRIKAGKSIDADNDKRALEFYDKQLKVFALPDCRKAEKLLTDNPNKPLPQIKPFYPGAPYAPQSASDDARQGKKE